MRLFIAEKPIQGKAIAAALGNGSTWAQGHLYEQAKPETSLPSAGAPCYHKTSCR